jgi:hypothetical protein
MHSMTQVAAIVGLSSLDVLVLYDYGSRVYGTNRPDSDYDYVIITDKEGFTATQGEADNLNVQAYTVAEWKSLLEKHDIMAMECNFNPNGDLSLPFTLSKGTLRSSISRVASNSWVKCKKKLTVEEDSRLIGIKSLFHSFRIPMFGIQIATTGTIHDYGCANELWKEMEPLVTNGATWEEIYEIYKPRHNELMTLFRKVAEKE